jgi:hypothetical protein
MNKTVKFLTYLSAFLVLNNICKTLTDDFSLDHLIKPSPKGSKWTQESQEKPLAALQQKYFYLSKGKQAHVFVSEDGEHVLKLLKPYFPHFSVRVFGKTSNIRFSKLPFAKDLFGSLYAEKGLKQRDLDFQSYVNSFQLLKEETEVEYLHLTETDDLKTSLKLYDKIGILRHIDLDSTCFILQKRTDLLYPTLHTFIKEGKSAEAKEIIDAYVLLCLKFLQKGIVNPTTVEKNFGCIGLKPIQIDVGRVLREQDIENALPVSLEGVYHCAHHMKKWLNMKAPELVPYLDESIETHKAKAYEKTL